MEENSKKSFWLRKVSLWHIVYLILISVIINVFLLCIVPGRINDDAYHNFAFAATITSIVLAVVSIVYSIQSGLSSSKQIDNIRDIESKIGIEINRFTNLEASIKEVVREGLNPIQASMGDIQQRQDDLQRSQDVLNQNWLAFSETISERGLDKKTKIKSISFEYIKNAPQIYAVILYTCLCCKETNKDIPYHILKKFFGVRSYYCEGIINGLHIFSPDNLKVGIGSKQNRQSIEEFNESILGTKEQLVKLIKEGKNLKLGEDILMDLNLYFDDEACV